MMSPKSALRKASARIEALELRSLFSGEIDHSFGASGLVNLQNGSGAAVIGDAVAVQADGKTVVAGHLKNSPNTAVIARYNTNGSIDKTFGTQGFTTVANVKAYDTEAVTVQSSGNIFVTGQYDLRLTDAGQLDSTYSGDGIQASSLASNRRASIFVQPDGSYFELSIFTTPSADGFAHDKLTKYKADGTVDKSFATGGRFDLGTLGNAASGGVTTDAAGRVYVSFNYLYSGSGGQWSVVRLTTAGKIDSTYGTNGVAMGPSQYLPAGRLISVLKDGRVLLASDYRVEHGSTNDIDGFSADGKSTFYVDFSNGGGLFFVKKIAQAADGSVYLGGEHLEGLVPEVGDVGYSFAAVQHLTANLTVDTKYSPDKDAVGGFALATGRTTYADFALNAAGQPIVLGETGDFQSPARSDFVRLTASGTSNHTYLTVDEENSELTINGSAANDHIVVYHVDEDGNPDNTGWFQTVVRFDDDGLLRSADAAFYADWTSFENDHFPRFGTIKVNLGDGNDTFDASGMAYSHLVVHGNNGNDKIIGTPIGDELFGDAGIDTLIGNGGDDVIVQ
jgi:uncharacterized delta-60 repeat protein